MGDRVEGCLDQMLGCLNMWLYVPCILFLWFSAVDQKDSTSSTYMKFLLLFGGMALLWILYVNLLT